MNIFNSELAKLFLPKGYYAITLGFISFYKQPKERVSKRSVNHENIHKIQYQEMFLLSLPITLILLICNFSKLIILLPFFSFYIWYLIEYFISRVSRLIARKRNQNLSYKSIAYEEEAHDNDKDLDYLTKRKPFAWIKYLGSI